MKKILSLSCVILLLLVGGTPAYAAIMAQVGSRGFDNITHSENFEGFSPFDKPGEPFSTISGFDFDATGDVSFVIPPGGVVGFATQSLYQGGRKDAMDVISLTDGSDISQIELDVSNGFPGPVDPHKVWLRTYNNSLPTGFDFDFTLPIGATISVWSDGLTVFDEIRVQSYGPTAIDHDESQFGAISIDNILVTTSVPEPPTIPDDTMAPTGAVHAHGNIIWPGNNRMVTVTLEGYVVDELSIARDGGGIGVSSAYLRVDGNDEIILRRDGYPDLLDDDGSFSVTTEVEAVKGAVINVELYATDTAPEEAGGPNSGLVDATRIRVPEDKALLSPKDAAVLLFRRRPATFEWDYESCQADRIEFSAYPDFSRALSLAVESGATSWTPDWKSWFKIKLLGIKGRSVYWRIIGTDPNGYIVQSEIFSFSFRRYFWWR